MTEQERKHNLVRQPEQPGFNSSFLTPENDAWFNLMLEWLPDPSKPLVFLPCGSAAKTRARFGKKFISQGTTHQFMSAVTRDDRFERVIVSEPLVLLPYCKEHLECRPDYNLPPDDLSVQSERLFIRSLALWLSRVKAAQPERKFVYYLGAIHHYFILHFANQQAGSPFHVVHEIPPRGTASMGSSAKAFKEVILTTEATGVAPDQPAVSLTKLLKSHGRYTHLPFWRSVLIERKAGSGYESTVEPVVSREQAEHGFTELYLGAAKSKGQEP